MRLLLQKTILLMTFLLICGNSFAQERKLKKAKRAYERYEYINAQETYLKIAEKGYKSAELFQNLGNTYYFNSQFKDAAKWYGKLINEFPEEVESEYYFRYAQVLKASKKYKESDKYMALFAEANADDQRGKMYMEIPDYLEKIGFQSGRYEVTNLAANSYASDFGASFYQDKIVFSSSRDTLLFNKNIHEWNEESFLDLYQASVNDSNGELSDINKLGRKINTKYHESTSVFTKDGNTVYFTRNNYTRRRYRASTDGTNKLKIYKSYRTSKGDWTTPFPLPFSSDEYSIAHPTLSEDEKTLYFSSDMPGGEGLSDIYKVAINDDGSFGNPENLGDKINTEGRESFPFVTKDNELYFASNGHIGLGGYDVYVTKLAPQTEEESQVINIGEPVNSSRDDFAFIFNKDSKRGYFSSNRDGGKGSDDIYSFLELEELRDPCKIMINGIVKDRITKEILAGAKVTLFDSENTPLETIITEADGRYVFEAKCRLSYFVRVEKEEYLTEEELVNTPNKTTDISIPLDIEKEMKTVEIGEDLGDVLALNTIYFDFDQSYIRSDAAVELAKVIEVMNKYPTMKIEVRSHTDSHGDAAYNLQLSDKRAKATVAYIIEQGIDANRITGKGFGESQPINDCIDGSRCKKSAYELNRRSEFIVVK